MEITKIQTVEEFEKEPVTKVTVQDYDEPFPELVEEKVVPVIELPEENIVENYTAKDGTTKTRKIKKKTIKKPLGDTADEVTEIQFVEEEGEEPRYLVTVKEIEKTETDEIDVTPSLELPEQHTVLETQTSDGKTKTKTVKTRSFKKPMDKEKDEITTIQFVEHDDDEPIATVKIEETPTDEVLTEPIPIEELPEEIVESEIIEEGKKPKKKTTKTRTFKKDISPEPEFYQIQTIEEEGQEPYSLIQVVSEGDLTNIIDISSLDDEQQPKPTKNTQKHKKPKEEKRIQEQTKDEKPVFITTFKSVQNEDGDTVIETENKKVTQEEGVLVEEVLSDTETAKEQDDEETSPSNIEIVEVSDITDQDTKPYTIIEPDDVVSEDTTQTEHTETPKQKPKTKKPKTSKYNVIEEQPEEQQTEPLTVEYLPEEVMEVELPAAEDKGDVKEQQQTTTIKKRKIKKKIGDQEQTIEVITTQKPGQEEEVTVVVTEDDKPEEKPDWKVKVTDSVVEKPKDKPKKKPTKKKLKKDELDDYIQFLIHQEIPKTVLQDYQRTEMDQPQKARRDSSVKQLKPVKLVPMKIEQVEVKKSRMVEISSVAEFPQMLKLKTPKQRPEQPKVKKEKVPFKTKLKSWINFVPYSPYNFKLIITDLETKRGQGELSRNVEEALLVLKKRHKKFKPTEFSAEELEQATPLEEAELPLEEPEKPETKYKRPKKPKKEEEQPEERKLKIGKGKIPQIVEEREEIILKPFTIEEPQEAQIAEQPKVKEETKKKKKPKKLQDLDTTIKFETQDFEHPESDTESVTKVVEVIEYQPEIIEEQQPEDKDQKKPKTKKKRKILQKTESSENIIEIIELPSDKPDEEEKLYEIIVTSSQVDETDTVQPVVTKKKKKLAKLKPQELEEFVAELQEQPVEVIEDNFYEISLTELQPTETEEMTDVTKKLVKRRKLHHKKGNEEQIIEIIEAPAQEGEEPVYEVLITDLEGSVPEDKTPEEQEKMKKKPKKMKKHELDAYIQQLIEAEIPKTELEQYEKIEFGQRAKKAKKSKPQTKKEQQLEGEQLEIGISEFEPVKEKPKQKKSKAHPKPEKPQEVPRDEETYEELQIQVTETTPEEKKVPEQDTEHIQVHELEALKELDDFKVIVQEVTEQTETVTETTKDGEIKEKTKTKRKIKKKVGDREYEVLVIEEQTDKQPEVEVTVITTEVTPEQLTEINVEEKPRKPKRVKKTLKQEELEDYIVRVINEAPQELESTRIVEEFKTQEKLQPDEIDGSIYSVKTTVEDESDTEETKPTEETEQTETTKTKKPKATKTKKVKVTETTEAKVEDVPQEITVTETEEQPAEKSTEENFIIDVTEEKPKEKPKTKRTKPKQPEETVKEYSVVIEELQPETVTQDIVDETGEEVKQTVTKRKLKKKEGNKEYLIEIVESFVENKPESEVEITTTEIVPEEIGEDLKPEAVTVKKFKKKKSLKDDHDAYIQQLIEQEIPTTELEQYEPTEIESKPKKKPKTIKKHHKKTTEIVDGVAVTVHEFDIKEVVPESEEIEEQPFEIVEEETPVEEQIPDNFKIGFTEEQTVEEKPKVSDFKIKPKKVKKSTTKEVVDEPVVVEEIEQSTEITEQPDEMGEIKKKTVTKRKIKTKSGPEEKVFEISETTHEDQPNAEITIQEITEHEERPEETEEKPQVKKPVKKSKKVPKEQIQDFVINVIEEYVTPTVYEEDEKKPIAVQEFEESTETVEQPTATGEVKKKTITKRKIKTKSGPEEKVFEIVEVTHDDQPNAEITVVEITQDIPAEVEKPKEKKPLKKTKKVPKEQMNEFIINVIEEYVKPEEPQEQQSVTVEETEEKPIVVEEIEKITEVVEEQDITGKVKPKTVVKRKIKTKSGPEGVEKVFEISEVTEEDKPISEVTIFEVTESEDTPKDSEQPKEKKIVKKPKKITKDQLEDYLVNVIEEYVQREEEIPEELPISIVEIDKQEEVFDVVDEEGVIKKQKVTKRKIKKQIGPKEEIIEIVETQREDQPLAEITVTTTEPEEIEESDKPKLEKAPKPKKTKKVKKDELEDYIMKLIEQDIPKTELEKYEKIDIDEPIKLKKKPKKELLQKPEKPQQKHKHKAKDQPAQEIRVQESQPEEEDAVFPVHVEELEKQVELIQVTNENGDVKTQKVIKRKIKKQVGPKEEIIEIVETQKDDSPTAEITVTTLEPEYVEEQPTAEKVKKPKKTKKVTKDELQDYIQKLIEEDIPKTELETYEKIDIDKPVKLTKKPSHKVKKVERKPETIEKPEIEEFSVEELQLEEKESPKDTYEISLQDEEEPVTKPENDDEIAVQEDKDVKKIKKTKHKVKTVEEQPQKEEELLEDHEIRVSEIEPTPKQDEDYEVKEIEEETKPTPERKKPKDKKHKPETKKPEEVEEYEVTLKESSPVPKELEPFKIEVIESQTEIQENVNEDGVVEKQTITKRKIKRQQGPKEDIIEIIEVKTDDQPDVEVTVVETQPEEDKPDEIKPTKKKTKKVKKDDLHDYIQKLIEEDIPKTELEKYEKIEFETKPKDTKDKTLPVEMKEEQPKATDEEKPKKKPKSKKPKEAEEDITMANITVVEEESTKEEPLPVVEIFESEPVEVQIEEVTDEQGKPKQKTTKKRAFTKKIDNEEDATIHVVTIQDEDSPEVTIIIDEEPIEQPVTTDEADKSVKETPTTKKPKKIIKKVQKDQVDDYIQKLIDEEIPKTTLEQYEKVEMPDKTDTKPTKPSEQLEQPKKDKKKIPKPSKTPAAEEKQDHTKTPDTLHEIKTTETHTEPQEQIEEKPQPEHKPEDTEQITPDSHKITTTEETIETKTTKHKTKPKKQTSEEPIVHKDYQINVIEEEPEEKEEDEEKPEIETIEEQPEEAEESHPIDVVEEEEEEVPAATEETVEDTTKPKKTKKKVVKKKTDDHDAIIQKLLEQDIEKTELEKYEKVEFDKPKKAKPEMSKLVPIKIERREQKPKKMVIVDAAEVPQMVKLKPSKRKEKSTEEQVVQLPKFKLKSRMVVVEYPPEALKPIITEIGALKSAGDLSRNIEEAEALLKFKPYKTKKIKKIKDDLEKVELEKYEKYVSSEEEPEEKAPYKKPEKPSKPEEKQEEVQIKLGKGKKKPKEEEQPESITLKKIPQKPQLAEEVTEEKTVKKHAVIVKEEDAKPEEPKYEMKPLEPLEFEDIEYPKEELEPLEFPEEPKKDKKEPKQKHKPKPKSKPEQEMNVTQIVPGEPKKEEEQPEEEIKFRIPESTKDEEPKTERKLKPVKKVKEEAPAEDTVKLIPTEEPKEKSPSPVPQAEPKEVKKPKSKKEKPQEKPKAEEKPDEQFEVSVHEEVVEQETPVDETVDKVKIKKKVPKKEQPIEEVKVVEEVVEKPQQEEIPVEYKITTTVIEPEELPEEHKVRVVDIDAKEVTVEEVIEEKVVTRKKKPKATVPEEYEFTVQEPKQPEPSKVEETTEEVTVEIQKPQEPTPEDVTVEETITQPIVEEAVEEVSTKKKKPKKKPVEDVATVEVKDESPVEEVVKEIPTEEEVEIVIPEPQKPKDYKFTVTETEAVEQVVEEVKKDEEEKPKPKPKLEKPTEVFPTYEIKTVESEAEKPITVEEEQPEEVKFAIKPKKIKEVPEEFEASVALTEPKLTEETEVETVVKTKKTKKPKKPEEEVAELQVQVVETQEKQIVQEVIEEPKVEEIVPEKPKERIPDEYKIKVSEEEPVPEEEVPEALFTVKPKLVQEKPTEEPEAEFILKESKPVELVTEEAQIKTKKIKKKPKEEAADDLKIKIIEEIPVEKPIEIVEEIEEIEEIPIKKAPEEVPKDYEFKLKEFEIPKEQVVEELVEESKPSEEPKPKEEPVQDVKVVTTVPTEEIIEEEVKTVKKKPKKPKEITEEVKVTVVEEIPEKPKPVDVEQKPEEEKPQEVIEEEKYPEHQVKVIDETPQYVTEEVEEQEVRIQRKKKPTPKVTEEPEEEVVFAPKKPVEDVEETKIIKKKPKQKVPEEEQAELKVIITEEIPQETELVQEIEVVEEIEEKPKPQEAPKEQPKTYEFSVKDIEPVKIEEVEQVPDEEVKLKKKPKVLQPEITDEPEVEISLKPKPEKQVAPEETAIVKKKSKPKVREEPEAELKIQVREEVSPEPEVQVVEEIEEVFETPKEEPQEEIEEVVFKPKKPKKKEEIIEEDVTIKKPVKEEEEQVIDVTLKPKKSPKPQEQDVEVDFKLPKEKQITQETSEETVQLKKKKKPVKPTEEAADELVIKQEEVIERPVEIEEEEIIEEAVVMRRKPKKPFKPQVEEHEEQEFSLSFKKPRQIDEGVAEEATVLKRRPKKPLTSDEAAAELHIKREEEYDQDEEEDIEEFVVAHKPKPKPKPLQITEEGEQEYTVKKLKRRKKGVEIPEFTDVENVTFRPKLTKTKEDVDQEFSIALDSYAEEEVSMSGKVKIKKPIKKTYSEAEDEHRIKIMQDYDDGQGPIIEEIRDDSSMEDTMYDVEEPEEYQIEELPLDDVDFTLKPKHKPKPRYSIQDEEEEQFLIGLRRPKSNSVTYDEDSLTFKKKRKVIQQVFNEDGASLNITREMNIEEAGEENIMFSICNYVADSDEAMNLVEGEKVRVVGRHSSEWWFVKKTITEEEGWVPAQYLMEAAEYDQYVQKKLHEKIDKLPVFERPGPHEKPMAPRFIEKLQPIHTPDGYTVQFECKVEGMPRPQIAWFRETAIIKPSQDFQMYYDDDNVATLIIREVFPEDAGRFTCVAKNAAGFTSTTTELVVETPLSDHGSDGTAMSRKSMSRESSLADILEGIPPTFSRKPKAQYVDEDTNVILECRLVAVPEPDIVWTFNGEEIDTTTLKNVRVVTESDMHMYCSVVHIKKVKKSQEGTYEVIATNREGESRLPIVLKVRTNEKEPPQVLEPLRNMIIREGESAVLTTQIVGNPAPKITWYKDGKPVKGNTKTEKDMHTLTLISPKRDQKGEYTVKAENPLGSVETSANLTIEEPPSGNAEPPLFVERFEEQNVPQKGVIRLPAKVTGNPVPEVEWVFNNNPLYPNERIQQVYDGENIELIIKNANPDTDSGDYKCIASNPLGKTSHGARVIVEVDEVVFTKKLKAKITIEEVQSLTLECETSHVVSTKWFFNGKELSGMDHRVVVEEGKTHKLVIKNTNLRDSGNYTCKVKDQETKSTVEVLPRKPEFIKPLEDYEVTEKDTAILDVEVSTDVTEMQWFKDGEKITPEKKNVDFIKDGKVHRLLIRNCTIQDEGEYSCKFADQVCKAELTVIELPPEIVKPLEDVTVTEGETATFTVELDKGDALIKWFKNGKEITFDERVQLSIDGKRQTITIKKAKPSDATEYSLKVGEQTSKAKLVVEKPLVEFIVPLPDVTLATKNTDAEFTVKLSHPDVEVTWFKKGKPIKPNKKHEVFVEATVRRLVIHDAEDDDAGEVSCTAANVTTSTNLCVEEVKTAPIIISDKEQTVKVKENDDVTMTIKYTGVPQPDAEWKTSKKVIVKSNRITPTIDEQSASLTIRKVVEEDEDEYTIKLRNPVGEAEASLRLVIMRKPSAPGAPQPLEVMHDSITLFWKAPEDDGKSDILEYILEYKDVKTEKWSEIRKIKDTTYTLSKLIIDTEYVFRSIAVNEVGPSPPSPLSPPIRLVAEVKKEKPTVQEPLQDITTEHDKEITLSCVFGGVPEPKVVWKKNGKIIQTTTMRYENRVAKYTIMKTTIEDAAEYTCVAENEVGSVETSCRVTLQEKPTIDIEEKYLSLKLRTGSDMTIPALVKAYPQPKVTWYKETTVLKTTKRQTIEINEITTTETKTILNIQKLTREDSGRYKLVAENTAGSSSVECTIKVIDKPSRPQSLEIKDVKKDSIKLEWTPPIDDGGLEINKYILEKCEVQNNVWMKVADFDRDITTYCVQKLSMNSQYMFRVVALNPIGESEPTESEPVAITKKFAKPSAPRAPIDVSGMNDTSFTLSWQESENDGGSKIIEYIVEIKEFHETEYRLLGSTNGNVPNILVTNVIKNKAYTFRIYAKNEVGTSEALETEDKIVVSRRITPPSPPQNLRCPDITGRSVTLDWEIPAHNGGSEITGYCIEKRSSTSTTWTKVITLDAHCLQYTVDNLKEKSEYWFRVSAENEAGLGAPAVTESIALKTHATVPSPPTAPLETRVIAANAHVFEWGIPESDGGAPLLGYHIAIRDMKKSMWIEVGRVPAGVLKFQIRDLQENHEYMIRIFAKNEIGLSEPLESEEPYKAMTSGLASLPDEPRTEMSSCNTSSWLRDHHMDADIHSYARGKLLRRDEYFFRIWAKMPKKKKNSK